MEKRVLDKRLERLIDLYENVDGLIEHLPVKMPQAAKKQLEKIIFHNQELESLMESIRSRRPPRLILVGRTGVGKSSLINAIFGQYLAETSPVEIGTKDVQSYTYESDGETLFEVMDTRGIAESVSTSQTSAEKDLVKAIETFQPDAMLFVMNATERAHMDNDFKAVQYLQKQANAPIPLVTVLTHVDHLEPARIKNPSEYPAIKHQHINDKVEKVEQLIDQFDVDSKAIIPVSAYIEWDSFEPHTLTETEQRELSITFDGRYNMDALIDFFEQNLQPEASIHLLMSARIERAIQKMTKQLIQAFSVAASTVALTPIPVSDMSVLIPLQIVLVTFIAYLSGAEVSKSTAKDFVLSLGGVGAMGYSFRMIAQQGSKFLNLILPGSGSVISSTIAYSGTYAMGKAAEAYYIEKVNEDELKTIVKEASEKAKQSYQQDQET
ncbi:Uncharacterized conserved protein, DUF697 family [Pelagirhabdus alkalitolerans]|uniref:Uncharacterized conserved protein, DUF697 family n=1 Tax=Pelagirhabdus alkalitolerans TaxID=1612202 RepID=A0A1G6KID1_9BACI|nr:GTPase [Pelagirhabdus alkalitolerans]SDC30829.1 Uncharacterized conserved protein, DUF697 family [Pelagirhabdus alkalitolerans]